MPPPKKTPKSTEEEKDTDESEGLLLGEPPESEEDLLYGKEGGELLIADTEEEGELLITDVEPKPIEKQDGLLLGTEKTKDSDDDLLLGGEAGELLTSDHLTAPIDTKSEVSEPQIVAERTGEEIVIAFDANLNERGKINDSYSELKDFLEQNNIRCIEYSQVLKQINLSNFDCFIFACPDASRMNKYEMGEIKRYVESGGSLLLLSHAGGDKGRGTNLNELSKNFGVRFINDQVFDEVHNIGLNSLPIIDDFTTHPIVRNIESICYRAGCSVDAIGSAAKLIANADSIAEPTNAGVIAVAEEKLGRVVALGSYEMFRNQMPGAIVYESHKKLFLNILDWLTEKKNEARIIQSLEKFRMAIKKHLEKLEGKEEVGKVGKAKKSTFTLPVLPPKPSAGVEDIDGIIYSFKEFSDEFSGVKGELKETVEEISSLVKGMSMGTVREIEKLKEEFKHFREDSKDSQEAMTTMFMEMGKGIEELGNKLDKIIKILKKKK